jgi:hypothetical protein
MNENKSKKKFPIKILPSSQTFPIALYSENSIFRVILGK